MEGRDPPPAPPPPPHSPPPPPGADSKLSLPLSQGILLLAKPPITARQYPYTGSVEIPMARSYTCFDWLGLRVGPLYRVLYTEGRYSVLELVDEGFVVLEKCFRIELMTGCALASTEL